MSDIGRMVEEAIWDSIIMAFVAGGVLFLGGFLLIRYLVHHISIHWN